MKSKTSFFNITLLRKNTIRFSPIWLLYLAFWTIALPVVLSMQQMNLPEGFRPGRWDVAEYVGDMMTTAGVGVSVVYGLVLAMAVFSYLYTARSVSLMHALPIRRSGLFLTNYVSGLLFMLVPNAVVALLTALATLACGVFCPGMILAWFLGVSAMGLFFFSFAAFVAMFTGHLLALPVFYAILNGVSLAMDFAITSFISPYLYGISYVSNSLLDRIVMWLTPVGQLAGELRVMPNYDESAIADESGNISVTGITVNGAWILAVYAVAGVVLAILAYLVYRRRHSESAGDVVSVPWARVLFRYGVGICTALSVGQGLYMLLFYGGPFAGAVAELICMIAAGALGFVVAQMLLNKSFRVLRKSVRGSVICAVVVVAIFASAALDVTGFTRRVPEVDQVAQVQVSVSGYDYASAALSQTESIEAATALHQYIVDHQMQLRAVEGWSGYFDGEQMQVGLHFSYSLKDGSVLNRDYTLLLERSDLQNTDTVSGLLQVLVDEPEYRMDNTLGQLLPNDETATTTILGADFTYYEENSPDVQQSRALSRTDAQNLYDAVLEDAENGRLPQINLVSEAEGWNRQNYANELQFHYRAVGVHTADEDYCTIALSKDMTATVAALQKAGVLNGVVQLMTLEDYYAAVDNAEETYVAQSAEEITSGGGDTAVTTIQARSDAA